MIINQECNRCVHDKICAFKGEYLAACEAVKTTTYSAKEDVVMTINDSTVDVQIKCPNMMTQSVFRQPFTPKSEHHPPNNAE